MSKEAAMAIMTGQPVNNVNPSLVVGDMGNKTETNLNPGLAPLEDIAPPSEVKKVLDSDRHAALAKKEALLVKRELESKKLEAQAKEVLKRAAEFEEKKKTDAVGAMRDLGFSDTEIFNLFTSVTEKKEPTAEELARSVAQEELGKYKTEQQKAADEVLKTRQKALIDKYTADIEAAFKADPDKYEFSTHYGAQAKADAMFVAQEAVKDGGEPLSPTDIAEIVEAMYEGEAEKLKSLKKMQAERAANPNEQVKKEPERTRTITPPVGANLPAKTLTNKVTATVASTVKRNETRDQKRARLEDALRRGVYK